MTGLTIMGLYWLDLQLESSFVCPKVTKMGFIIHAQRYLTQAPLSLSPRLQQKIKKIPENDSRCSLKIILDFVLLMKQSGVLWVSLPVLGPNYQFSKLSNIFFIILELRIGRLFSSQYISLASSCYFHAKNWLKIIKSNSSVVTSGRERVDPDDTLPGFPACFLSWCGAQNYWNKHLKLVCFVRPFQVMW